MQNDRNLVLIDGTLEADPIMQNEPGDIARCIIQLRVDTVLSRGKAGPGATMGEPCHVRVGVWGRLAETCGDYLRAGRAVRVAGHLAQSDDLGGLGVEAEEVEMASLPPRGTAL